MVPMPKADIRACTQEDIDAVLALEREWEQEGIAHVFVPNSPEYFFSNLNEFPALFWVAALDHRVVGYINGTVQTGAPETVIPADEKYVVIEDLYVTSEFRHARIGGRLLERLMDSARHHGIQRFVVGSNSRQMGKILTFYQSYGFTLWQVQLYQ
jgi:ribosomal protein S18 acetylase RimI-like enzyme